MITSNPNRIGHATSSEIVALTTNGKTKGTLGVPALTYIGEIRMERLLGRSIDREQKAKALSWGKMLERRVFDLLGLDYTLSSQETDLHPIYPELWAGSKDGTREGKDRAVIDMKCPISLASFCQLVMPLYCGLEGKEAIDAIRYGFEHSGVHYKAHKDAEKYYWQLVSNACINNTTFAELIVYMPYESELPKIRELADGDGDMYWLTYAKDEEIPYLKDGGYFRNVNVIRFEVPQADKDFLTERVVMAGELLESKPQPSVLIATQVEDNITLIEKANV